MIIIAAAIAYLPAANNNFIADDWVILHRVDVLRQDPLYLNESVPENFRFSSYVVFGVLKEFFGYNAGPYYVFNILLHALNCLLLAIIVMEITGDRATAFLAGVFLAVFQSPQEAVMWLAAMNETLSGFFALLTLLLWFRKHHALAGLTFIAALYSKESALILIVLLPLVDWLRGDRRAWKEYLILALPAMVFSIWFLLSLSANFQVGQGTYALGPRGALVLLKSLHRLVWPWGYVILMAVLLFQRNQLHRRTLAWAALIPITMLPYIFVSYTDNIPSRQTYLASAVLAPLLAAGILSFKTKSWRVGIAGAFVVFNVIYMWRVKDPQMEYRALPTTALVQTLRMYTPQEIRLRGFEYPVNLIPKSVAVSLPGWQWDQVDIEGECGNCLVLEWSREDAKYSERPER